MKKYIFALGFATMLFTLSSCSEDKLSDESIFDVSDVEARQNEFDKWIKTNLTDPYIIRLMYRLEDMETDLEQTAAPADFVNSRNLP